MKKLLTTFAVLGLMLSLAASLRAENLDGTKWQMHPKIAGKPASQTASYWKDYQLVFDKGQVTKGLSKPIAYTMAERNGKMAWSAENVLGNGTKIVWNGIVDGDNMTGTIIKTNAQGKVTTYEWKARKHKARKSAAAPAKQQ